MNRDVQSLLLGLLTLAVGVLALVLTTSVVWPIIILVAGAVCLVLALSTPARD